MESKNDFSSVGSNYIVERKKSLIMSYSSLVAILIATVVFLVNLFTKQNDWQPLVFVGFFISCILLFLVIRVKNKIRKIDCNCGLDESERLRFFASLLCFASFFVTMIISLIHFCLK